MSGDRVRVGFAVKLVPTKGSPLWASHCAPTGGLTCSGPRQVFQNYVNALVRGLAELKTLAEPHLWRVRIVAIYRRPRRTAEQERADVVAWLREDGQVGAVLAHRISLGDHVGKADAK